MTRSSAGVIDLHVVNEALLERYRCPETFAKIVLEGSLSSEPGFFRFGPKAICYGRSSVAYASRSHEPLPDLRSHVRSNGSGIVLPFDPSSVISDMRSERYVSDGASAKGKAALSRLYYLLRPFLAVGMRKYIQRAHLRGWERIPFPRWPVESSIEDLFEALLEHTLRAHGVSSLPFIWFWPDGFQTAAIMTHDVETTAGRDFIGQLMDLDDEFGIKASFQIVPEQRYHVTEALLDRIRHRGHEVNVHDLNHDGRLFTDRGEFLRRAERINHYARLFAAEGFRSAVLYRNLDWLADLDVRYDMSIPNLGHLEIQRGCCCSVMPFLNRHLVELPVTTTQDYSLFHILNDYSTDLWERQIGLIGEKHGLASFIVHPDYLETDKARTTYRKLLSHIRTLRQTGNAWVALPREVARWWRERSAMRIVGASGRWTIEGQGSERARLAFASLGENGIVYRLHRAGFPLLPLEETWGSWLQGALAFCSLA